MSMCCLHWPHKRTRYVGISACKVVMLMIGTLVLLIALKLAYIDARQTRGHVARVTYLTYIGPLCVCYATCDNCIGQPENNDMIYVNALAMYSCCLQDAEQVLSMYVLARRQLRASGRRGIGAPRSTSRLGACTFSQLEECL